jgi:putative inorganic carbon (HCO3(-)) transporter
MQTAVTIKVVNPLPAHPSEHHKSTTSMQWIKVHASRLLPITPVNILLLAWLSSVLLSLLVTADPDKTLIQFTKWMSGFVFFYICVIVVRKRPSLLLLAKTILLAGLVFALLAPIGVNWNLVKGIPIPAAIYNIFPLILPNTIHPNVMASIIILILPLALAYALAYPANKIEKAGYFFLTGFMGLILLLTKSRGGYVAGAAGVIIVLWLLQKKRWALFLTGGSILAAAILLFTGSSASNEIVTGVTDPGTMQFRFEVWRIALRMMEDFPFTGIGMGSFNDVAVRLYPFPVVKDPGAHNVFLQVGVDLGIPGLVTYAGIIGLMFCLGFSTFKTAAKAHDKAILAAMAGGLGSLTAYTIHSLLDNGLWGTVVAFLPWLIWALILTAYMIMPYLLNKQGR